MERQLEEDSQEESMDVRARRLINICGAVVRLSGNTDSDVGSLRNIDSSHIRTLSQEMETDSMPDNPKAYASILEIIKSPRPTYEELRADSAKRKKDMENYRGFIGDKGRRKIVVTVDDVRS
ncbi:MAG TPA: hypothetical protein VF996_03375 [Candidatus Saccharimonadales bacterium]|jgi:hypothetical protein